MSQENAKYNKWVRWVSTIKQEAITLCHHRFLYSELQRMARENPELQIESAFWEFFAVSYASYAAAAVRRLVKGNNDSISFSGLLKDLAENPREITLSTYRRLYDGSDVEGLAEDDFRQFSDESGIGINVSMVLADLDRLKEVSETIEGFADRRIAHIDKRAPVSIPTFKELDECIDEIERLACKYRSVICAVSSDTMCPTIQGDYLEIFRLKWINS